MSAVGVPLPTIWSTLPEEKEEEPQEVQRSLKVNHRDAGEGMSYLDWRFLMRANMSRCPAEYCSITSMTS